MDDKHGVSHAKLMVHAARVYRKHDRAEDVDDRYKRGQNGNDATRIQEQTLEDALLIEVCNDVARPKRHAHRHGDEIHRCVCKKRDCETSALQGTPKHVGGIVNKHREEKRPVCLPCRFAEVIAKAMKEYVLVLNQEDGNRKQSNRRIVHLSAS